MWWEEGEAEAEIWRGEDCESLCEDVCDGLLACEVRVELVAVIGMVRYCFCCKSLTETNRRDVFR